MTWLRQALWPGLVTKPSFVHIGPSLYIVSQVCYIFSQAPGHS